MTTNCSRSLDFVVEIDEELVVNEVKSKKDGAPEGGSLRLPAGRLLVELPRGGSDFDPISQLRPNFSESRGQV